jgi:Outer membrane protein beta-barrel domain
MKMTKWLVMVCVVMSAGIPDAQAQMIQWQDRGYLSVNFGIQPQSRDFDEVSAPEINGDPATITVPHTIGAGAFPDFAVGYRLYENLGVHVGYSYFSKTESPTLTAQIPHPFLGGINRTATASAGELSHSESAFHLHLLWMIPLSEEIEIAVLVGPSFYNIKQDFVETVSVVETPPDYTSVSISSVQQVEQSDTAVAFTAGLDGTYRLTPRFGIGAFFRYSGASADMPLSGGNSVTVEAGGIQIGGGLRVRF